MLHWNVICMGMVARAASRPERPDQHGHCSVRRGGDHAQHHESRDHDGECRTRDEKEPPARATAARRPPSRSQSPADSRTPGKPMRAAQNRARQPSALVMSVCAKSGPCKPARSSQSRAKFAVSRRDRAKYARFCDVHAQRLPDRSSNDEPASSMSRSRRRS